MGKFSCISGGLDHFFDEKITGRKTGSDLLQNGLLPSWNKALP
jgi:hypothetical protein